MARDPNRRREEIAPTVLTRRSSVWSLWSVSSISSGTRQTRETGRQRDRPKCRLRVSRVSVSYLQRFVMGGARGGLHWRRTDCRSLYLFNRGCRGSKKSILIPEPEFPTILRPNRSFAVRPMPRRPLTTQYYRLRRQKNENKGFDVFVATDCD
jgi:hypothetical protein